MALAAFEDFLKTFALQCLNALHLQLCFETIHLLIFITLQSNERI